MSDKLSGDSWRSLRDQVFAHVTRGDRASARQLLREAAQYHPREEQIWLWLARYAVDDLERRAALEQALQISPFNQEAKKELASLRPVAGPPAQPGLDAAGGLPPIPPPSLPPAGGLYAPGVPSQPLMAAYQPGAPTQPLLGGQVPPAGYGTPGPWQQAGTPGAGLAPWTGSPAPYGAPAGFYVPGGMPGAAPGAFYVPRLDRGQRPGCITGIAFFFMLTALLVVLLGLALLLQPEQPAVLGAEGGPAVMVLLGVLGMVVFGLALTTSYGLWRGGRYGWWMATVALMMAIPRVLGALTAGGTTTLLGMGMLGLYGAFLFVLFSDDGLRYFGMSDFGKIKAFVISIAAAIGVIVGLTLLALSLAILAALGSA